MVHTHTRSYGAGDIRWRMNMKMKGWPTHPNKRTTGEEPKTTKEGQQQQQGRGRRQEARGGGENSTKQHNKHNRERLSGDRVWCAFHVWWTTTRHTKHKRRRGTQQGREGHKHTPDPGNNQGQPWKGRKKQRANNGSGDGGEGDEQPPESLKKTPKT